MRTTEHPIFMAGETLVIDRDRIRADVPIAKPGQPPYQPGRIGVALHGSGPEWRCFQEWRAGGEVWWVPLVNLVIE